MHDLQKIIDENNKETEIETLKNSKCGWLQTL